MINMDMIFKKENVFLKEEIFYVFFSFFISRIKV